MTTVKVISQIGQVEEVALDTVVLNDMSQSPMLTSMPAEFEMLIAVGGPNGRPWLKRVTSAVWPDMTGYAPLHHTHVVADITDFNSAVNVLAQAKIDALVNGAPAALDTLKEISDRLATDESAVTALISSLSGYVTTSALSTTLSGYVSTSALTSALASYATTAALTSGLAGKANLSHTHAIADVTNLQTALDSKMQFYVDGVLKPGARMVSAQATVASGNAVFQLTTDGTAGGTSLFPNGNVYLNSLNLTAVEGTNPHCFGTPALSNSNKTLTVPVNKSATVVVLAISVLGATMAANGSVVQMSVVGD